MLKQIIAVAFLSSVALGQFNLFDRQWKEGDPREICWEVCNNYCPNCTEPVRCGENEKKCGEKPIDPNMSQCPVDDVCVPDHCLCKFNINLNPIRHKRFGYFVPTYTFSIDTKLYVGFFCPVKVTTKVMTEKLVRGGAR